MSLTCILNDLMCKTIVIYCVEMSPFIITNVFNTLQTQRNTKVNSQQRCVSFGHVSLEGIKEWEGSQPLKINVM